MDFLSRFSKENLGIRIDLYITNAYLNLVAENIDVAIRFGHLKASSVVAAKLGKSVRDVVASADYLRGRKLPAEPDELTAYDCVMFNAKNYERRGVKIPIIFITAHCDQALHAHLLAEGAAD